MKSLAPTPNTRHVRNAFSAAFVSGMLLLLVGCRIPCLQQAAPPPPMPDTFNGWTSPGNSALLGIDEFFNDPALTSLIDQALAGNQQLRILTQDIAIANNEIMRRRGAY